MRRGTARRGWSSLWPTWLEVKPPGERPFSAPRRYSRASGCLRLWQPRWTGAIGRIGAGREEGGLLHGGIPGEGCRRSQTLRITASERARLRKALPLWEKAQRRL